LKSENCCPLHLDFSRHHSKPGRATHSTNKKLGKPGKQIPIGPRGRGRYWALKSGIQKNSVKTTRFPEKKRICKDFLWAAYDFNGKFKKTGRIKKNKILRHMSPPRIYHPCHLWADLIW
jgi:hypothetical protein